VAKEIEKLKPFLLGKLFQLKKELKDIERGMKNKDKVEETTYVVEWHEFQVNGCEEYQENERDKYEMIQRVEDASVIHWDSW